MNAPHLALVRDDDLADTAERLILACGYPTAEHHHVTAVAAWLARDAEMHRKVGTALDMLFPDA